MISKPMTQRVQDHFDKSSATEEYLLETTFTPAELQRIVRGRGTEAQPKAVREKIRNSMTYADYLKKAKIKLKSKEYYRYS